MGISLRNLQRFTDIARGETDPGKHGQVAGLTLRKTAAAKVWLLSYANSHDIMPNASTKGRSMVGQAGLLLASLLPWPRALIEPAWWMLIALSRVMTRLAGGTGCPAEV